MLERIDGEALAQVLRTLGGRRLYLHLEVTPGGFLRNLAAELEEAVLRCDGESYRLALRCRQHGWIVMEGLTHAAMQPGAPLLFGTLEGEDRLTRVLQLSEEVLTA